MSPKKSSMIDKTRPNVDSSENSFGRKVVGMGFALVGLLLILGVIILNVISNIEPQLDEELNAPKLDEIVTNTNSDQIVISGTAEDAEQVIIYVNDDMLREVVSVEEDMFSYTYDISEEGEYVFEAVTVEGFPFRRGSEKSNSVKVLVDWTPPSADVKIDYESEVATGLVTVTGEVESNIFVRLLEEDEVMYEVESDDEGFFEIENVRLQTGENEFRVELEDKAGNKNVLARRITVTSLVDAPEVMGEDLPEASGDLIRAMGALLNNRLMTVFGILAMLALVTSSGMVIAKKRSEL
jgi:hypothetical protein